MSGRHLYQVILAVVLSLLALSVQRAWPAGPTYTVPDPDGTHRYPCSNSGPLNAYLNEMQSAVDSEEREISRYSAQAVQASEAKQKAQYDIDHTTNLPDLRKAQHEYAQAVEELSWLQGQIHMDQTEERVMKEEMAEIKKAHDESCGQTSKTQPPGKSPCGTPQPGVSCLRP